MKTKAKVIAAMFAALIASSSLSMLVFAAPEDGSEPAVTTAPTFDVDSYIGSVSEDSADDDSSSLPDFYQDPYYDTDGNATLISNQQVIYSSAQLQFISVTTKDGNVFYVVIDYSDTDGDNVYFLNKVDDFDLFSLLYTGEDGDSVLDSYLAGTTVAQADGDTTTTTAVAADSKADADTPESTTAANTTIAGAIFSKENLIIFGGIALLAICLGAYGFIKLRGKKQQVPDDDFFEETEINEDDEEQE